MGAVVDAVGPALDLGECSEAISRDSLEHFFISGRSMRERLGLHWI